MKNIDSSLKTLDKEISADAKLIAAWGAPEGDDLSDVCQRMAQLMEEVGLIQQAYSLRHTAYRKSIKSLKIQEMTLDENRKKKQDLISQIAKAQKSSKENPIKLMDLQATLERVTAELDVQELELKRFKRVTIKEAFDSKFEAMLEYAEKMALIAGYGRAITLVIDTEPQIAGMVKVYNGAEYTAGIINQVKGEVTSWQPQSVNAPARTQVTPPTQDELALSAAATACNTKTPPLSHTTYAANDGYSASNNEEQPAGQFQEQEMSDNGYTSPPTHAEQVSKIQEQQRRLELEQQRLYQKNLASYSPETSSSQQHYQDVATSSSGGAYNDHSPAGPQRGNTQEYYSPPVYDSGPSTPGGYSQPQYGQYEGSTYGTAPARNYRLGFVDPREREQGRFQQHPSLPPLHFTQSPILHEK
ncbi:Eisosome component PIL1-domain-containing protein [Mortierella sp. GBAus27b]|nr:Eisosome component PIL1-domain-containing protein [Mortierella sp. GBAus27b]